MNGICRLTLEQCAHIPTFYIPHLSAVGILTALDSLGLFSCVTRSVYITITHIPEKTRGLKYAVPTYNTISRI